MQRSQATPIIMTGILVLLILTSTCRLPLQPVNTEMPWIISDSSVCSEEPPFVPPSQSAPTILMGSVTAETSAGHALFKWRLFSPNVSVYTPGDFWTSFDLISNVSGSFEDVFVHFQDQEDPWNNSSINFGSHLVSDVLTDDGEFEQYLAYRNSTYFFLNGSYNYLFYPQVDGTMVGNVSVTSDDEVLPIFDFTILAETMFPKVDIISPQIQEESDIHYSLNLTRNWLIVNASDPSGIENASLVGIVESDGTSLEYLFTSNSSVTSGSPFNLSIAPEDVQIYATLTNQTNLEIVIINAFIEVYDTLGWRTRLFVKLRFDIRSGLSVIPWDVLLIGATLMGLAIVAVIIIVRVYRRKL